MNEKEIEKLTDEIIDVIIDRYYILIDRVAWDTINEILKKAIGVTKK